MSDTLRIGTRGSRLAMWQSRWVADRLAARFPAMRIDIVPITTTGDRVQDVPLAKIGDKGLFTKELDAALLDGRVDLVVHSLKDVPTVPVDGIVLASVPEREDPRDAFIGKAGTRLADLPRGACVATGSLRRRAQLKALRPDLDVTDLRGNIDTRLRKVKESEGLHGTILALAGVKRLGMEYEVTEALDAPGWLCAPGQGALGIATRADWAQSVAAAIDHAPSRIAVTAERAVLARIEGGCHVPMGTFAYLDGNEMALDAFVANLDGTVMVRDHRSGPTERAEDLGTASGEYLLEHGGVAILERLGEAD